MTINHKQIQDETTQRMENALISFQSKIKKIRTGLAHASLVEGMKVSCYGGEQELKHIASISCPDARTILISPWDVSVLQNISSTLVKSDLGMAPIIDKRVIRLKVPELTEDKKKELIKAFKKDVEKTRIELRQIRQIMTEKVRKNLKEKTISEDEKKDFEKNIQETTDHFIKEVNELSEKKQQELIRV